MSLTGHIAKKQPGSKSNVSHWLFMIFDSNGKLACHEPASRLYLWICPSNLSENLPLYLGICLLTPPGQCPDRITTSYWRCPLHGFKACGHTFGARYMAWREVPSSICICQIRSDKSCGIPVVLRNCPDLAALALILSRGLSLGGFMSLACGRESKVLLAF